MTVMTVAVYDTESRSIDTEHIFVFKKSTVNHVHQAHLLRKTITAVGGKNILQFYKVTS